MVNYTYSKLPTINFNTTPASIARSATGSVYAIGDTTYTTPLNMTLVVGGSVVTSISSDANGLLPDFTLLDRTSCVWKQAGVSFATVLTTSDPVPGPAGATGGTGATGAQGVPGDVSTWKPTTFYPLNTPVTNPSGDLVKVTTAHTSTGSYDAAKFEATGAAATKLTGVVPDANLRPDLTVAALSATYAKRREINVADYGAVGDWNGSTGTDNLAPFNAAVAAAVASGAPSKIVIGPGDYRLSNNWLLDGENIAVECDPSTVIRTTAATTTGAAVTFMGNGVLSPNNVSTPQRNSFRWRGGKIVASGSGTADNALGVVRVKNCHISDVTLDADRKGLTAQYGIDNIAWERIVVTRAGVDGIAIETACHRIALRDVQVISATGIGVNITSGDAGARNSDVLLDGVVVNASATGISLGLTDRATLRRVRSVAAGTQDFNVSEVTDLSVSGDCSFTIVTTGANVTYKKPRKVTIPLLASWVAFGAPHDAPSAYRTSDGMIILDGAMKSGTISASTKFGTLPVGHRPANRVRFLAQNAGGADHTADIYVEPNGEMFFGQAVASSTIVSLSGVIFPAV
ncbi:hypothetical protein [Pseudarthrobacter sp. S6]|uniref:hypothetical protein n=1 Tax=Pseudarthrobacter sp. S6 TaxID=3418420 RepID=UPI003CF42B3B